MTQIPRKLHVIWVGDDSKRPEKWIKTWRDNHPGWEVKVWGNAEYDSLPWTCKRQMDIFRDAAVWEGVADIMRYEILHRHGGVYVDADSQSVRPLGDELLDHQMFAVWESEKHKPGQIANGFIGSVPGHPVLADLIEEISRMKNPLYRWSWTRLRMRKVRAWKSVGPMLFTKIVNRHPRDQVTILPSILFIPKHYADKEERVPAAGETIYARHAWGTTYNSY